MRPGGLPRCESCEVHASTDMEEVVRDLLLSRILWQLYWMRYGKHYPGCKELADPANPRGPWNPVPNPWRKTT